MQTNDGMLVLKNLSQIRGPLRKTLKYQSNPVGIKNLNGKTMNGAISQAQWVMGIVVRLSALKSKVTVKSITTDHPDGMVRSRKNMPGFTSSS